MFSNKYLISIRLNKLSLHSCLNLFKVQWMVKMFAFLPMDRQDQEKLTLYLVLRNRVEPSSKYSLREEYLTEVLNIFSNN